MKVKLVGDRRCSAGLPVELAGSLPVLEGGERGVWWDFIYRFVLETKNESIMGEGGGDLKLEWQVLGRLENI
jgi:hypothetical protein